MKKKVNGTYRARLNTRGFEQEDGKHFDKLDIAAPFISDITIRVILVIMIIAGWIGELSDIRGVFLHGDLRRANDCTWKYHRDLKNTMIRNTACSCYYRQYMGSNKPPWHFGWNYWSVLVIWGTTDAKQIRVYTSNTFVHESGLDTMDIMDWRLFSGGIKGTSKESKIWIDETVWLVHLKYKHGSALHLSYPISLKHSNNFIQNAMAACLSPYIVCSSKNTQYFGSWCFSNPCGTFMYNRSPVLNLHVEILHEYPTVRLSNPQ